MMFNLLYPLPQQLTVAVSGGPDSMAALHFLNVVPNRVKGIVHVHHNTGEFSDKSLKLVQDYAKQINIPLSVYNLSECPIKKRKEDSSEEYWRIVRYYFFYTFITKATDLPFSQYYNLVTAHTLDDCVEEYIINKFIRMKDKIKFISYSRPYALNGKANAFEIIRPFRTWKKTSILKYCKDHSIPYVEDPTNYSNYNLRGKIRINLMPELLKINPGIYGCIRRMIEEEAKQEAIDLSARERLLADIEQTFEKDPCCFTDMD